MNANLDTIIDLIDKKTSEFVSHTRNNGRKYNLSPDETASMNNLKGDASLHVTKADKGGAFVIMDNTYYINQMKAEHTSDSNTYTKVDRHAPHLTMDKVISLCKKHKTDCHFTKKELDFITNFTYNLPILYGLPKIHKLNTAILKNATPDEHGYVKLTPTDTLKFRPIISSSYAPTSHISALIDELLKPLVPKLTSYCRDTHHFITQLSPQSDITEKTVLASFDVVSLYTNIPHELGIESISFWLDKQRNLIPDRFSNQFILSSVDLILKNNYFRFEDDIYLQISGTAMGTKMAPTYAILVMAFLEEKMYTIIKQIYNNDDISNQIIKSWIRYIDDCFILWKESYGDISNLKQILESLHPSISFTMEADDKELHFLDVKIYIENNKLETDIFHKITDSRSYVPFTSAHPKHVLLNIPYTLAKRIYMIVSNSHRKQIRLDELKRILLKLQYPHTLIENSFIRAATVTQPNNDRDSQRKLIPFVSTYNKNNPDIYNNIISPASQSLGLLDSFKNHKFIKAYRQPKCLLRILNNNDKETFTGITKCSDPRCSCCETLITGTNITLKVSNTTKVFTIKSNMNCLSLNVIYVLICRGCNDFYIGQTGGMFRKRLTLHRQHIANPRYAILEVSKHIANCAKDIVPPFSASPILKLSPHCSRRHRENKENAIISMLSPQLNRF
jgi:hypothetical protein